MDRSEKIGIHSIWNSPGTTKYRESFFINKNIQEEMVGQYTGLSIQYKQFG